MVDIDRVRVALTGFNGGPGVATFYGLDGGQLLTPIHNLFDEIKGGMCSQMTAQVENVGDKISATNGELVGAWSGDPEAPVVGEDTNMYPAPVGVVLTWLTNSILHGKRLKGRTYIVPLGGFSYQTEGTINATNLTVLRDAADAYAAAVLDNGVVWHRPRKAKAADGSRPAVSQRNGDAGLIVAASVKDSVAVLRSRRA